MMPLGAVLFIVTMIAEVERIPFDMPEAEAELVEGWWTEYGGIRWGLMFAVEMMRAYAACILFALFFLGGWELPLQDTLVALPLVGGVFSALAAVTPGIAILLIKATSCLHSSSGSGPLSTGFALTRSSSSAGDTSFPSLYSTLDLPWS